MGSREYQTEKIDPSRQLILFAINFTVYVKWLLLYNGTTLPVMKMLSWFIC